uniref:Reverse transcriptase domain-containing protein n=1 Tax=Anopheles atroparvus TaxID=41427 RepID=A0AAG5D5C3_ANOAO
MEASSLRIAPVKTELVTISSLRQGHPRVPVNVGGCVRRSSLSIRYLGVMLHDHLLWNDHVASIAVRSERAARAITCLMRNHSGPGNSGRRLLAGFAASIMRYVTPVWHHGVTTTVNRWRLECVQRLLARRLACTFRRVRYCTAMLVAGLIPTTAGEIRQEGRRDTIARWQPRWDADAAEGSAQDGR